MTYRHAYALLFVTLCISTAHSRALAQQPAVTQSASTQPARSEYAGILEEKAVRIRPSFTDRA
jgi:hypothetical protein